MKFELAYISSKCKISYFINDKYSFTLYMI